MSVVVCIPSLALQFSASFCKNFIQFFFSLKMNPFICTRPGASTRAPGEGGMRRKVGAPGRVWDIPSLIAVWELHNLTPTTQWDMTGTGEWPLLMVWDFLTLPQNPYTEVRLELVTTAETTTTTASQANQRGTERNGHTDGMTEIETTGSRAEGATVWSITRMILVTEKTEKKHILWIMRIMDTIKLPPDLKVMIVWVGVERGNPPARRSTMKRTRPYSRPNLSGRAARVTLPPSTSTPPPVRSLVRVNTDTRGSRAYSTAAPSSWSAGTPAPASTAVTRTKARTGGRIVPRTAARTVITMSRAAGSGAPGDGPHPPCRCLVQVSVCCWLRICSSCFYHQTLSWHEMMQVAKVRFSNNFFILTFPPHIFSGRLLVAPGNNTSIIYVSKDVLYE